MSGDNSVSTNDMPSDHIWGVVDILNRHVKHRSEQRSEHRGVTVTATTAHTATATATAGSQPLTQTHTLTQPQPHTLTEPVRGESVRGEGDFSVPVGVSSKRRKIDENTSVIDTESERGEGKEGKGENKGEGREGKVEGKEGKGEGQFVMPTGLGVGNKRERVPSIIIKKDTNTNNLKEREKEREKEKVRETEKEKEKEVKTDRRLLYESNVRHTTLGLDMSLSHIHKFVGHRYDHDLYTQVK